MNTAKAVKEALYLKRKTQTDLAGMLGVSPGSVSQICNDENRQASTRKLTAIAKALDISLADLIALGE